MKLFFSTFTHLKKSKSLVYRGVGITLIIICVFLISCSLIKLQKDTNTSQESTVIVGRIYEKVQGNGPIIVAACSTNERKEIAQYTVLHDSGEYELMVDQGNYYVIAYRDRNSNLIYEAGEPAGQYGDPTLVRASAVGVVYNVDVDIPEESSDIVIPHGSIISSDKPQKIHSRQAGDIAGLDDERFSEEFGTMGFWEPYSFFRQFGGNIYFLEEYDPSKIPILFIHGACGTTKGWWYFVKNIDRSRYQPWFFYYPTGARINSMAYLLYWKLTNLQTKYQFNKIHITAHSMGGLVARSFIVDYGEQFPYVKLFISLATPWGGDSMAEYGVQQSPAVIPSWIDMQPEGDFIESLYRKKIPKHVSFCMFYGHRGSKNPFRSNNDGTITLSSLLDYRSQSEAKMNYAFNEDHASIAFSKEVLTQYNIILNEFDKKQSNSPQRPGGYIKIQFSYNYDFDGVNHSAILILHPIGKKNADTVTYLNADDNGRVLGPFPSGDYVASMVMSAAKPAKNNVPISIESNKTRELDFGFIPDGVIRGCVTTSLEPEDKFIGMPDYRYRSVDRTIKIQSISLEGSGIQRILQLVEGEDVTNFDYLISRDDFCYNTCFGFFGVPAGDYELTIKARGYKSIVKKFSVIPGIPEYFRTSELTLN